MKSVPDNEFWNIVEEENWEPAASRQEIAFWLGLAVLVPMFVALVTVLTILFR